jgi:ribonuclease Z
MGLRLEDCVAWPVPNTPWTLQGHSRGSERTGFCIPELHVALDAGISSYMGLQTALLTHSHGDHASQLPSMAHSNKRVTIRGPPSAAAGVRAYCASYVAMDSGQYSGCTCGPAAAGCETEAVPTHSTGRTPVKVRPPLPPLFEPMAVGDRFNLRPDVIVTAVECLHAVPCHGFVFSAVRSKLLPECAGLSASALRSRRQSGQAVSETVEKPLLVYLGDTAVGVFDTPAMRDVMAHAPVVVVECTFVEGEWAKRGHIAWSELAPVCARYPAVHFVLIHFSWRYTDEDVLAYFRGVDGGAAMSNVSLWLDCGVTNVASLHTAAVSVCPVDAAAAVGVCAVDAAAAAAVSVCAAGAAATAAVVVVASTAAAVSTTAVCGAGSHSDDSEGA